MDEKQDSELEAMRLIHETLEGLADEDARRRVLHWAAGRYGTDIRNSAPGTTPESQTGRGFSDFPSLFDAARPRTGEERALVAAYWFQTAQGHADLDSQSVNTALKNMGHGDTNITSSFSRLQRRRPALILQVQKSGRARQARKKYRLTAAGSREVEGMLAGRESSENGGER